MGVRKNWRYLTAIERTRLVQALLRVKTSGLVDQFAAMHDRHFFHNIHRSSHFLPWHREMLIRFERALHAEHPDISIPYWDSTIDRSSADGLWANDFLGQFNAAWNLQRVFGGAELPTAEQVRGNQQRDNYDAFWRELENPIHNRPHVWVGGVMGSTVSPGDPVFYFHHGWIDRLWAQWQLARPGLPFQSSGPGVGVDDPLMEWPDRTPAHVLAHRALGYTYDFEVDLVVGNFGYDAGGWRTERHPRLLADLTGDGCVEIVGFGNAGVWTARNNGDGNFQAPSLAVGNFGYDAGGWRVERHPRFLADLTGDGRADIVGFGNAGVWIARNNGDGTFQAPHLAVGNFGYDAGGWRVERHPRFLADLTGDGRADIVGFGNAGVWTARNNGDGTFQAPSLTVENFGYDAGGWRVERHPRLLADLTGDGRADIVGFGNAGVWIARNNGDGTFQAPHLAVENFGHDAGGWRVERHPRFLADVTGDGRADIVGFGNAGVWIARNNGDGTFQAPYLAVEDFGYDAGGWRVDQHPRFVADMTGDGRADIIGFGNAGVWVARNRGDGTFQPPQLIVANFGHDAGSWRVDRHPRFIAKLKATEPASIVGFGNAGVLVPPATTVLDLSV